MIIENIVSLKKIFNRNLKVIVNSRKKSNNNDGTKSRHCIKLLDCLIECPKSLSILIGQNYANSV